MQIEEAFRDMKTERYGVGLNGSHTTQQAWWTMLLLIAALAHLALWLLGLATIQARHHYQYQAHTTRHRLVLSAITLGRHVIQRGRDRLPTSSPVGRVASQPSDPVCTHDTMKFVGSPQLPTPFLLPEILSPHS